MSNKISATTDAPTKRNKELSTPKGEITLYAWKQTERNESYMSNLVAIPNHKAIRFNDVNHPDRLKFEPDASTEILQKKIAKRVHFESCLINHKSEKTKTPKNQRVQREILIVERETKYLTTLDRVVIDVNTGEINKFNYSTDSFKQSNHRKIRALDRFCGFYQPLYRKHKVSLFFVTLTAYDKAQCDIKQFLDAVKFRLKYNNRNVLGYIWTLEVSENNHAHYHMCFATERVNIVGGCIPDVFKFESLWGARTEIEFVKKNVRHYLSKYFAKHNYRLFEHRSYGTSNKLNLPN